MSHIKSIVIVALIPLIYLAFSVASLFTYHLSL